MSNDEKKKWLIRLDDDYFGCFDDQDWDLWFGAVNEGWMEKFAGLWVESERDNKRLRKAIKKLQREILKLYPDPRAGN